MYVVQFRLFLHILSMPTYAPTPSPPSNIHGTFPPPPPPPRHPPPPPPPERSLSAVLCLSVGGRTYYYYVVEVATASAAAEAAAAASAPGGPHCQPPSQRVCSAPSPSHSPCAGLAPGFLLVMFY